MNENTRYLQIKFAKNSIANASANHLIRNNLVVRSLTTYKLFLIKYFTFALAFTTNLISFHELSQPHVPTDGGSVDECESCCEGPSS
jgi:hypothetical protein